MAETGLFISLEGIDGAGKSTQAKLLVDHLEGAGHAVVQTREPGGAPGAEAIRRLLVEGDPDRWSPETEILLFTAARRDHLEKTIKPALGQGKIVLTDRFADSTRVYQGATRGDLRGLVDRIHDAVIGVEPDLTLILDMDPEARRWPAASPAKIRRRPVRGFRPVLPGKVCAQGSGSSGRATVSGALRPDRCRAARERPSPPIILAIGQGAACHDNGSRNRPPPPEPDRIEGRPPPARGSDGPLRTCRRGGGIPGRISTADRLHHAWLISGPQRRGQGDAGLAAWRGSCWPRTCRMAVSSMRHRRRWAGRARPIIPSPAASLRLVGAAPFPACAAPGMPSTEKLATQITIDETRKLKGFFQMSAADGGRRVVIVDAADEMNTVCRQCASESAGGTAGAIPRFFLVSHQPARLLPTIRSRCRAC